MHREEREENLPIPQILKFTTFLLKKILNVQLTLKKPMNHTDNQKWSRNQETQCGPWTKPFQLSKFIFYQKMR